MRFRRRTKVTEDTPGKEHKYDLFPDLLNNFTKQRKITDQDIASMSFIMARFLSMCSVGFDAAASYNDVALRLPDWAKRLTLFHMVPPMGKPPYMKYVGNPKEKISPKAEAIIAAIQKHYKCRRHHAEEVYKLLKLQKQKPGRFFGLEDERK